MAQDLQHWFGNDLDVTPTGDLMTVGDVTKGHQRLVRRLLTMPSSWIWHPDYGAGIPLYIGEPLDVDLVTAIIRYQTGHEAQVARDPQAQIIVFPILGGVQVRIIYTDADSGNPTALTFDLNE